MLPAVEQPCSRWQQAGPQPASHGWQQPQPFTCGRPRRKRAVRAHAAEEQSRVSDQDSRPQRAGKDFGGGNYIVELVSAAPRVRTRSSRDRQQDQLADLAVLNERLAGDAGLVRPWEARKRLDYLKCRRQQWEAVYEYVTKTDAAATLATIEEAYAKVVAATSEEAKESASVGVLQEQLRALQADVDAASRRLAVTRSRVESNMKRVDDLRAEAAQLERMKAATELAAVAEAQLAPASTSAASHAQRGSQAAVQDLPALQRSSAQSTASSRSAVAEQQAPPARPQQLRVPPSMRPSRVRGLSSSMALEEGLRNHWYPAHFTSRVVQDVMVPIELFGEPWVLFRDEHGAAACVRDECAHRACPLSLGSVIDGRVQCAYHGWEYDGRGECTKMPSTAQCSGITIAALPCLERDGFVWIWTGPGAPPELPSYAAPPSGFTVHAEIEVEVPVEHGLLMENLLDLAHAPFTHTSTFAKGWPIPDVVRFKAEQMLAGMWEPYPIDMAFQPPCMVLSTIGLAQPGKIRRGVRASDCENHLHQLHICLPSREGYTRLLYRMSMDFMDWTRHVPGIQLFWKNIAGQVLGEDLVLVSGQQQRLQRGGDTWANPVSYDKLAVRYRRWRNGLIGAASSGSPPSSDAVRMSAGQLFQEEESDIEE